MVQVCTDMLARPPHLVNGNELLKQAEAELGKLGLWNEIQYSIGIGYWYCSTVLVQYCIGYSIGVQTLV